MIDAAGFRPNVGIIIFNREGQLLWTKRVGQEAWQFPQGGIADGESPEEAAMRELHEEVGLRPHHVDVVATTEDWLHYRLPSQFIRQNSHPVCIGQKQKWFLLYLLGSTDDISFENGEKPEFDDWRWVNYWYPLNQVIEFKRGVYREAMLELQKPLADYLTARDQEELSRAG